MTPKQKAKILREIYGGLMTLEDVRRELGCTKRWAKQWLENHQIRLDRYIILEQTFSVKPERKIL